MIKKILFIGLALFFMISNVYSGGGGCPCLSEFECCAGCPFIPAGGQPIGYSDSYSCSGPNSVTGTNFCVFNDYYCNGVTAAKQFTASNVATCGTCKYCTPGSSSCSNYASGTDSGLCSICNGAGASVAAPDDSGCGTIDCDGLNNYFITGTQGATSTSYCKFRNYVDITANRCEGINNCKDANTADCTSFTDSTVNTAGTCKYIAGCNGVTAGSIANYPAGTDTGLCRQCNGAGGESVPSDDGGCGTIDCDGLDSYSITGIQSSTTTSYCKFKNYADITTNRCEGLSDCKDANTADCSSFTESNVLTAGTCKYVTGCSGGSIGSVANYPAGTSCGVGFICDDFGTCIKPDEDIGLRMYDGTQVISIAAEPLGTLNSPLRIYKNGNFYGILLVDISDPDASNIRVNTKSGVKALKVYS